MKDLLSHEGRNSVIITARRERDKIMSPSSKGGEYGCGYANDNFRKVAEFQRCSPQRVLITYLLKHLIAIENHVEAKEQGRELPAPEGIRSKIFDCANYLEILDTLNLEDRWYDFKD